MDEIDNEIKQAFFEDSLQLLEAAEALLISMDAGEVPPGAIDTLFRTAHNIKGGSMTMGYERLSEFAHAYEDVLSLLKKGTLALSRDVFDVLFSSLDAIKAFVTGLKSDDAFVLNTSEISARLKELQTSSPRATDGEIADVSPRQESIQEPALAPPTKHERQARQARASEAEASAGKARATSSEDLIRVNTAKLDTLLNFIGELVINQSIMSRHRVQSSTDSEHALQTISYMAKLVNEIQDVAMGLRMTNVRGLFQKMQRAVRDIASAQEKDIVFATEGEHVELDRTIIERMNDPLTHLIRNAVDHGIESREARIAVGKSERATVSLSARQQDDIVLITVRDDGKGLDPKKLIAKAVEKGLIDASAQLSDAEAYQLIFKPGFSTKEQVTDISGRGVGMDVVIRAVEDMKGTIHVETELGKGTSFVISLPLSLSIINGMVVEIDRRKYVVPVAQLLETLEYRKFKIESSTKDGRMINLRGEVIPVFSLGAILDASRGGESGAGGAGIVASVSGRKISFEVDGLLGQQQVVIKKLGTKMEDLPGIIGGAILSNGEPSLVLNLHDFAADMRRRHAA